MGGSEGHSQMQQTKLSAFDVPKAIASDTGNSTQNCRFIQVRKEFAGVFEKVIDQTLDLRARWQHKWIDVVSTMRCGGMLPHGRWRAQWTGQEVRVEITEALCSGRYITSQGESNVMGIQDLV
jgi:hypothetical protein